MKLLPEYRRLWIYQTVSGRWLNALQSGKLIVFVCTSVQTLTYATRLSLTSTNIRGKACLEAEISSLG